MVVQFHRNTQLASDVDKESCIVVGLFHDLGKVGVSDNPYYLDNADSWQKRNRGIHYVVNKDLDVHNEIKANPFLSV